jgi:hypothetical protein
MQMEGGQESIETDANRNSIEDYEMKCDTINIPVIDEAH